MFKNITYRLGRHELKDFESRDFIIKAAGVPFDSEFTLHAKEQGISVYMSTALFASLTQATLAGVTGTRGSFLKKVPFYLCNILSIIVIIYV